MLSKQGWRIIHNDEKYFAFLESFDLLLPTLYLEKYIASSCAVIEKVDIWRVADGHLIKIWDDNWLSYQNRYTIWSPIPPNCDIIFVSDLIHHDIRCWNTPLINEIFSPFGAQQLQLSISFSQLQDEFVWGALRSSIFYV